MVPATRKEKTRKEDDNRVFRQTKNAELQAQQNHRMIDRIHLPMPMQCNAMQC